MHQRLPFAAETRFAHIYVHLPFCEYVCHYCDFYVALARTANHENFFLALSKELDSYLPFLAKPVRTIYFGGGTPSESPAPLVAKFLAKFAPYIDSRTEICLEANPTSIDEEAIAIWAGAGINRLSIGVQSLQNSHLQALSRKHTREEALAAIQRVVPKIPNVNVDLIYGIPNLSVAELREDAQILAQSGAQHLSAYTLTLPKHHFLFSQLPDSNSTMDQSEALMQTLQREGLHAYEASNYARPGSESQHNQSYWSGRPYLALGPSAHGFDGQKLRWKNLASWQKYCEFLQQGNPVVDWSESLSAEQQISEFLLTRLRTRRGINFNDFHNLFGTDLLSQKKQLFSSLAAAGLGSLEENVWKPSFRGLMLADEIALKLS